MDFYFLLFSLFFPRIVMLAYLFLYPGNFPHHIPVNSIPQWADILMGIFVPRVLILIYIYQNLGYDNIWFAAHLIVMIFAYLGGGRGTQRRWSRRGN